MADEKQHPTEKEKEALAQLEEQLSEEEEVRLILERARQDVKRMAMKEREGETIPRELLSFRMRQTDDA